MTERLFISRPLFREYMKHMFFAREDWRERYREQKRKNPRPDPPGIRDRRARHSRVVLNPDHHDTTAVFFQTLIARRLSARGVIELKENYTNVMD
jgi:hypothetical protein